MKRCPTQRHKRRLRDRQTARLKSHHNHLPVFPSPLISLRFALIACSLFISSVSASAPLEDYAARLEHAEKLIKGFAEGEPSPQEVFRGMAAITRSIPPHEEIEFAGNIIRVDNSWLHDASDKVIRNAESMGGNVEQRRSTLREIADRLSLLLDRLKRSQTQQSTKVEEDRARLEVILARPEYHPEVENESTLRKWLRILKDWLWRLLESLLPKPRISPGGAAGIESGMRILLALIVLAAIVYGIIQLTRWLDQRRKGEVEKEVREVLGEEIPEAMTGRDLFDKATELARTGDYRSAIRRAYVALLCELEERGKLRLHRSKTNRDYLDVMRSEQSIFNDFSSMTGAFELVWYGEQRATDEQFNDFIARYEKTISRC
jgi:Domain of unknown function (DUF4129)